MRRRCWPECYSGLGNLDLLMASEPDCHCKPPWWVLYECFETHKLEEQMPGGSRLPIFRWQLCPVGTWSTHPLHMSCSVGHRNTSSLFLGSERTELVKAMEKQTVLHRGECSLLIKQHGSGSALSSGLITGQCQGDQLNT